MESTSRNNTLTVKKFIITSLLVSIWVNISETARYFMVVMPEMKKTLSNVPDIAPITLQPSIIWILWSILLSMLTVFLYFLYAEKYGKNKKSIIVAGTISWAFFFLLFWIAMPNMNLSNWSFIIFPLSLAWIEIIVATYLTNLLFKKYKI